jgi:drug/metabolite transporter (DMT)-like permease
MAAFLGGVAWLASAVVDWGVEPETRSYVAGLVLLVICLAGAGYALVATAPAWLRALVTVATPALGYSVWLVVRDAAGPDHLTLAVAGSVLVLAGAWGLVRRRTPRTAPEPGPQPPVRGRRAAR